MQHSFLIVTLSSGIIASLNSLIHDPTSIPSILASNLPKASTFFLTYVSFLYVRFWTCTHTVDCGQVHYLAGPFRCRWRLPADCPTHHILCQINHLGIYPPLCVGHQVCPRQRRMGNHFPWHDASSCYQYAFFTVGLLWGLLTYCSR